jgi:hypothetical protein
MTHLAIGAEGVMNDDNVPHKVVMLERDSAQHLRS